MYTPDRFLEYASTGAKTNRDAIKEVRNVQKEIYSFPIQQYFDPNLPFHTLNNPAIDSQFYLSPANSLPASYQDYLHNQQFAAIYGTVNPYHSYQNFGMNTPPNLINQPGSILSQPTQLVTKIDTQDENVEKNQDEVENKRKKSKR